MTEVGVRGSFVILSSGAERRGGPTARERGEARVEATMPREDARAVPGTGDEGLRSSGLKAPHP